MTPDTTAMERPGGPVGPYQVHAEARGLHWIAWITRGNASKPDRSVVLVAASREEAEARAKKWAEESGH